MRRAYAYCARCKREIPEGQLFRLEHDIRRSDGGLERRYGSPCHPINLFKQWWRAFPFGRMESHCFGSIEKRWREA